MRCAVASRTELRRHIGVVFQAQSNDPKLTAYENLSAPGNLYGLRGAALKSAHLEISSASALPSASDAVEKFSGGMERRVELAKGLLHHPSSFS